MPGLAGGDVLGGCCGKQIGIRGDADATEVEAVGVEADGEDRFGLGRSAVVDFAGGDEESHAKVVEVEVAGLAEFQSELCAARAVLRVAVFVLPAGVVEKGEEADDFLVGLVMADEVKSIAADGAPVGGAVVGLRPEAEPGGDDVPEWLFGRKEIGKHVFRRME
jgi:hypothetical protein